jgi:hypothetical protein
MAKGWISIHRKLQCHWLWEDKPFSKGQAWVDLLLLANHEDTKFLHGGQLVDAKRGDVITSEVKLMGRWGWSKTKVRTFLEMLEKDSMIVKKADNKKTTLTLVNYGVWQDSQTAKEPQKDFKKTSKRLQKDTINNVNNSNNENKYIYAFNPPPIEEVRQYCQERKNTVDAQKWHDFYSAKGWMVGKNKMKDWKAAVRTWEKNNKPNSNGRNGVEVVNNEPLIRRDDM